MIIKKSMKGSEGLAKREDLKYNFLKAVIVRIDFQGVFETEVDRIIPEIKPLLMEKGFTGYKTKRLDEIRIDILEKDAVEAKAEKKSNLMIHSFVNASGYTLDICKDFICLNLNSTSYVPFDEYGSLMMDVANVYKEKIDFCSFKRIGIRKINICMAEDKKKISSFFSDKYFGYYDSVEGAETLTSRRRDTFKIDPYKVNLACNIDQGTAEKKKLYKVTLDIDIYLDDKRILELPDFNSGIMKQMNDVLFDVFISTLTDDFITALSGDDAHVFSDLIGVEPNEG